MKIELIQHAASDLMVANSARVSLDKWHDEFVFEGDMENDAQLISWLMRSRHGSPFEHGSFSFRVEAPIFVFREWHRHRAGHSYNEMSGRYTELEERFYTPEVWRTQKGKPGAYTYTEIDNPFKAAQYYSVMENAYATAWDAYQFLLKQGVAKEQARCVLPVGIYSKMIWTCNPRSLMHFLSLRNAPNAQAEIRDLAVAAEDIFIDRMPVTAEAFINNERIAP